MRYSPKQYASALLFALEKKSAVERKKIFQQFLSLVNKKGDSSRLGLIVRETERQYLKNEGLKKVTLESADPVSAKVRKEVEEILGRDIILEEKINPELIAGIKILVNDELLIDASAENQLRRLFTS